MPLISAIVPIYNVEKYLHRCIDSILCQSYTNFELIMVDDGSTDRCAIICDEYASKDGRVRVIHQENSGVSAARNAGIDAADGDYITFVDSDDFLESVFLQDAVQAIRECGADIYLAGHKEIKEQGVAREIVIPERFLATTQELSERQMIDLLAANYIASSCGKLISREVVGQTRFDVGMNFGEDLKFMHEIIQKPCIVVAESKTSYCYWVEYRGGTNLTSLVNEKKCTSVIKTYRILFDLAKKWGNDSQYRRFIATRWIEDYICVETMIFQCPVSIWRQHKLWRILLSEPELKKILIKDMNKNQQEYLKCPEFLLLKRYASKIKRTIMKGCGI